LVLIKFWCSKIILDAPSEEGTDYHPVSHEFTSGYL